MNKEEIEAIFRNSDSHGKLFDTFEEAIRGKIDDVELYKILLANPVLMPDEVIMFGEKVTKEFPGEAYDLYIWIAELFSTKSPKLDYCENSLRYFTKAFKLRQNDHTPLISSLNLYNYDLNLSHNDKVIEFIIDAVRSVEKKSLVYKALAGHYKKIGDEFEVNKYLNLAAKASKRES